MLTVQLAFGLSKRSSNSTVEVERPFNLTGNLEIAF